MPIYPFERMVYPTRLNSPFLSRVTGKSSAKFPGGLLPIAEGLQAVEGDASGRTRQRAGGAGGASTPKVQQQYMAAGTSVTQAPPPLPYYPGGPSASYITPQQQLPQVVARPQGPDRSIITAAGGIHAIGGPEQVERLPSETGERLFPQFFIHPFRFPSPASSSISPDNAKHVY